MVVSAIFTVDDQILIEYSSFQPCELWVLLFDKLSLSSSFNLLLSLQVVGWEYGTPAQWGLHPKEIDGLLVPPCKD